MEFKNKEEIARYKSLIKGYAQKDEVIKETKETVVDVKSLKEEVKRLKLLAEKSIVTEQSTINNQFSGNVPFVAGYGQTVNTFIPANEKNISNKTHNPNYTYLQPAEALNLSITRSLESGAPVNDKGFYDEVNWNLNNLGFDSKLPLDIKNAINKMIKK